jgi:hypothetical protein
MAPQENIDVGTLNGVIKRRPSGKNPNKSF